jgi:hypothetical protein
MKLYNIFQNLILEQIFKRTNLFEEVSIEDIEKILAGENGKHFNVSFDYPDKDGGISNRFVQIHQRNISTIGNNLIDAYQLSKNGQSVEGWKKFNLNKMSNLKISKIPFYQPKFKFNRTGNNSPTVASTPTIAQFDYQYAPSTIKKMDKTQKTLFPKVGKPSNEPVVGPQRQQPTAKQPVRPMKRVQPKPVVKPEEPIVDPEENEENNLELNK